MSLVRADGTGSEQVTALDRRGGDGRFVAGTSGNPAGRPPMPAQLRDALYGYAASSIEILGLSLDDPDVSIASRLSCASRLAELAGRAGLFAAPIVAVEAHAAGDAWAGPTGLELWQQARMVVGDRWETGWLRVDERRPLPDYPNSFSVVSTYRHLKTDEVLGYIPWLNRRDAYLDEICGAAPTE